MGSGQLGGQYTLWADSELSRKEWQQKLLHAKALRSADIEANKVGPHEKWLLTPHADIVVVDNFRSLN
jgi:hypothetical protein